MLENAKAFRETPPEVSTYLVQCCVKPRQQNTVFIELSSVLLSVKVLDFHDMHHTVFQDDFKKKLENDFNETLLEILENQNTNAFWETPQEVSTYLVQCYAKTKQITK